MVATVVSKSTQVMVTESSSVMIKPARSEFVILITSKDHERHHLNSIGESSSPTKEPKKKTEIHHQRGHHDHHSSQRRGRRRVHFAADENGRVREEVYKYEAVSKERSLVYSSLQELQDMAYNASLYAEDYASKHPEWVDSLESLLLDLELDDQEEDVIRMLSESDGRGLERSCSALLRKHKQRAVQSVLGRYQQLLIQKSYREQDNDNNDETEVLLRTRSEKVSKYTRGLALKLARGDEVQARQVFVEEPTLRQWLSAAA